MSTSELLQLFLDCNNELLTPKEAAAKIEAYYIAKEINPTKPEPIYMEKELEEFMQNEFANIINH